VDVVEEFDTILVVKILVDVDVNDELVEVKFDCKMFFTLLIKGYFPFKLAKLILNILYFIKKDLVVLCRKMNQKNRPNLKSKTFLNLLINLDIFSLHKFTVRK
jgi:hypothetical protein